MKNRFCLSGTIISAIINVLTIVFSVVCIISASSSFLSDSVGLAFAFVSVFILILLLICIVLFSISLIGFILSLVILCRLKKSPENHLKKEKIALIVLNFLAMIVFLMFFIYANYWYIGVIVCVLLFVPNILLIIDIVRQKKELKENELDIGEDKTQNS